MKWFWTKYKSGIMAAVLPLVVLMFGLKLVDEILDTAIYLNSKTFDTAFTKWAYVALLILLPYFAGIMLSWHWFRELALRVSSKIPIISLFAGYLFNKEDADTLAHRKFPEVFFEYMPGTWAFGQVMNEKFLPEDLNDPSSRPVPWLVIIGPMTTPFSVTGHLIMRRKADVTYTGRFFKDTLLTVASLGMKFQLDPRKFSKNEPQE